MQPILISLPVIALLPGLIGLFLSPSRSASHTLTVHAPPETLWALWMNPANQPAWRPDLGRVEVENPSPGAETWTEHPKRGPAIRFTTVTQEPLRSWTIRFEGPATGTWTGNLEPLPDATTRVHLTETTTTPNPYARVLARLFFNPRQFLGTYAAQLKAAAEATPLPD